MGDDLCCCGVDGLGWKTNKGNLVHLLNNDAEFSEAQKTQIGENNLTGGVLQGGASTQYDKTHTFEQFMRDAMKCKNQLKVLIPES